RGGRGRHGPLDFVRSLIDEAIARAGMLRTVIPTPGFAVSSKGCRRRMRDEQHRPVPRRDTHRSRDRIGTAASPVGEGGAVPGLRRAEGFDGAILGRRNEQRRRLPQGTQDFWISASGSLSALYRPGALHHTDYLVPYTSS